MSIASTDRYELTAKPSGSLVASSSVYIVSNAAMFTRQQAVKWFRNTGDRDSLPSTRWRHRNRMSPNHGAVLGVRVTPICASSVALRAPRQQRLVQDKAVVVEHLLLLRQAAEQSEAEEAKEMRRLC